MLTDILYQDAVGQLEALVARRASARELLEASVARADQLGSLLNAVVSRDLDRAFAAAQQVDERRAHGERLGRLAGLPMTVKDLFDLEGRPAAAGLAALLDRPAKDAEVVARVRAEGALVWGKTNAPVGGADWQTYNPLYGTTNNPWNPKLTPGGSSGGSAVAVAAGISALEIGSDSGGSLRVPASFCGVFAHKPTFGLVSQRGQVPPPDFAADLDLVVVGPMARSARDLQLGLSVIADRPCGPLSVPLKGLKVGLWLEEPSFVLDPQVKAVVEGFAGQLTAAGAVVEPVGCPVDAEALMYAYTVLLYALLGVSAGLAERSLYEALRGPAKLARALGARPLSWAQAILAASARHRDWLWADETRVRMANAMPAFFDRYDVLIAPTAPVAAFPHNHRPLAGRRLRGSDGRTMRYTEVLTWVALATALGLPATAVPVGLTPGNLPVGVQIIGPRGGDALTLAAAQAIDQTFGGFQRPPLPTPGR